MAGTGSFPRDANFVPITVNGPRITNSITFTGSNTTVNTPIFTLTGTVEILSLYAVVTTDIGVNHTAAAFRINDQTSQVYLTAVGGVDISAIKAGSMIFKKGVVATAITKIDNIAGAILEPTTLETNMFTPVVIMKKTVALTQVEYHYATTDTPTTGAMKFYCGYVPLSDDGLLTAV